MKPKGKKGKGSREEGDESERTPVAEPVPQGMGKDEIDLNETAKKQGLMTDEEFEALLDEVTRIEDGTAEMAEGLDLASKAVGGGDKVEEKQTEDEEPKSGTPQPEAGESDTHIEEKETEVQPVEPEKVVPPVLKPKAVRKLVLKDDPKAERKKPKKVSQRCFGKWTSSKAGANTAASAVEISGEEERTTPTKPGEESLSATNLKDASTATEVVSPTPSGQREETDKMAEGLDLASESIGHAEPVDDSTHIRVETQPAAQKEPSTPIEERLEEDEDGDEDRYLQERKRKGKAPVTKKPSSKKQRTVNTGIVITESDQRAPLRQREPSDSEYTASEESGSESDVSLEDEEYGEKQLPHNHRELMHPPVERLKYRHWRVELTYELIVDMKHFSTKKLQDAFDDKDDGSKQIKSGKVLYFPSLDELNAREPFLSHLSALCFDWLLENRDPSIPIRLAKKFFTTFRFRVTADLDEESITFRVFGREVRTSLIEWTVRLGMCSLEEAIGPEWRSRERGIPRRHIEFEPQEAWVELTHPAVG
ncbi:ABC transporter F family member 4-like [Salvia splendens]|uniref:ABC transporter F family member 4-like n=1 Tax=Salvia splendens TaxID=180675 RepID=UPI001C26FCBA|nr:ABC transporter F family member 4-like [Salvia splendens]